MCDDCYNYCKTIGEEIHKTPEQVAKLIREFAVKEFEKLDEYYEKNSTIQLEENNKIKDKKNIKEMKIKLRANIATIKRQITEIMNDSNLSGCLHEVLMSEGFITENDDLVEGASTLMQDNDIVLEMFNTCLKNQTECGKTLREALKMKMIKRKHSPRLGDDSETLLENDTFDSKILPIRESVEKLNNFKKFADLFKNTKRKDDLILKINKRYFSFYNNLTSYFNILKDLFTNPKYIDLVELFKNDVGNDIFADINNIINNDNMLNAILENSKLYGLLFNQQAMINFQIKLENIPNINEKYIDLFSRINYDYLDGLDNDIYLIKRLENDLNNDKTYLETLDLSQDDAEELIRVNNNFLNSTLFDIDKDIRTNNDDIDGEEDDVLYESDEIKGKNVDNENEKNSKKDIGEMLKQSTDTQKTTQEKVENLKNQKYQLDDKKTSIKNTTLGFRNNLDLDYNSELSKDQKDKIKDEVKGVAPKDHANVDVDSKGGEDLLNSAENRRKEESIHDEDWTSIPTKTDVTNNPDKEKDNLFKEEVIRMNNLIDYDKIRLKKIKGK